MRVTLTSRQLVWIIILVVIGILGLSIGVFALGQRAGTNQLLHSSVTNQPLSAESTEVTETLPPTLPVAMTATPRASNVQEITFTNAEATQLAQEQSNQSSTVAVQVQSVAFLPGEAQMSGVINYMGFNGPFEIAGVPYVEENRLRLQITSFKLAGQALPASLYGELQGEIDRLLEDLFRGYDIQSVDAQQGLLRLSVIAW